MKTIKQRAEYHRSTMWTYKGVDVFQADRNSSGIRWYARNGSGLTLRADSKASMRHLINEVND